MLTVRTILHPTDFSKGSDLAFRLACSLAQDYGARLVVLHVVVPPVICREGIMPPPCEESRRLLREQLHMLRPRDAATPVEHRLVEGYPAAEILRAAEDTKCDAIVMGTHGRTALAQALMGSVAEQVVRNAPCPVVTVKAPLQAHPGGGPAWETATTLARVAEA